MNDANTLHTLTVAAANPPLTAVQWTMFCFHIMTPMGQNQTHRFKFARWRHPGRRCWLLLPMFYFIWFCSRMPKIFLFVAPYFLQQNLFWHKLGTDSQQTVLILYVSSLITMLKIVKLMIHRTDTRQCYNTEKVAVWSTVCYSHFMGHRRLYFSKRHILHLSVVLQQPFIVTLHTDMTNTQCKRDGYFEQYITQTATFIQSWANWPVGLWNTGTADKVTIFYDLRCWMMFHRWIAHGIIINAVAHMFTNSIYSCKINQLVILPILANRSYLFLILFFLQAE